MSKSEMWDAVLVTAAMLVCLGIALRQPSLPTVYTSDGECVRVTVLGEDGKDVEQDCSTVDLANDQYHHVFVASEEERRIGFRK